MSKLTVPEYILRSPSADEINEDISLKALKNAKFYEIVHDNKESCEQELHQNRLKSMRKELDYLKETAWMYPSFETLIGQNPH